MKDRRPQSKAGIIVRGMEPERKSIIWKRGVQGFKRPPIVEDGEREGEALLRDAMAGVWWEVLFVSLGGVCGVFGGIWGVF